MLDFSLEDLLKSREVAKRQIKDLTKYVGALDVLIKRKETFVEGVEAHQMLALEAAKAAKASKRRRMVEIVKPKRRAKPKEVLAGLLAEEIMVSPHYVHNELSALYKAGILDREKGQYFLRKQ